MSATTHEESTGAEVNRAVPVSDHPHRGPVLDFRGLDVLWLQITGTVCNIACRHCFITCGPKNDSHPIMGTDAVLQALVAGERQGVKEYYFTGGEPFLHPEVMRLIGATLQRGPLSILTNGILIDTKRAAQLAEAARASEYGLDLRVSLDGTTSEENDPVRGRGTFEQILAGARELMKAGINPVFTVTTVHAQYNGSDGHVHFMGRLRDLGFPRPRVKFIPPFQIGREARRSQAYPEGFLLSEGDLVEESPELLQCGSCRTVTAKGVYPCPILIEESGARMTGSLDEALVPIELNHPACVTCHQEGFSCRT